MKRTKCITRIRGRMMVVTMNGQTIESIDEMEQPKGKPTLSLVKKSKEKNDAR